jgi:hypothetical protein
MQKVKANKNLKKIKNTENPVEPGDAPRLGFGHRKVYLL